MENTAKEIERAGHFVRRIAQQLRKALRVENLLRGKVPFPRTVQRRGHRQRAPLLQFLVRAAQLRLGPPQLGDVAGDVDRAGQLTASVVQGCTGDEIIAVQPRFMRLELVLLAVGEQLPVGTHDSGGARVACMTW